ncbi:MAG: type 1 glutamine amidotransferase-like domain-containing protein [Gammaproteobacteria bacterium]|nr:type 1 glutamine amidotransferase-like domain-containing protein [Gammaproteobacteria bacterium]
MKLLLTSAGFTTNDIVQACVDLVGKPKDEVSFAVINEAYVAEAGDHRWVIDDLNNVYNNFAGEIELINLVALSTDEVKNRIDRRDVILTLGGHTDYLMKVFNDTGFSEILPELLKSKTYVGSSAGSMVLTNRASSESYQAVYGEEANYGITQYLGFVDACIKPHLESPHFPNNRREKLATICKDLPGTLYALKDDSAILIDGDKISFIGSEPFTMRDGCVTSDKAA